MKHRLEICCDRYNHWLCKIFSSCVNFQENNTFLCQICAQVWIFLMNLACFHTFFSKTIEILHLHFVLNKKGQNHLYWNLCCFIVIKNSRDLRFFSVCKFLTSKSGRVIFLTNFKSGETLDASIISVLHAISLIQHRVIWLSQHCAITPLSYIEMCCIGSLLMKIHRADEEGKRILNHCHKVTTWYGFEALS